MLVKFEDSRLEEYVATAAEGLEFLDFHEQEKVLSDALTVLQATDPVGVQAVLGVLYLGQQNEDDDDAYLLGWFQLYVVVVVMLTSVIEQLLQALTPELGVEGEADPDDPATWPEVGS